MLEVQKKEVEALTAKIEQQFAEWEKSYQQAGNLIITQVIDKDPDIKKRRKESKEQTEELKAAITGYKQMLAHYKGANGVHERADGFADGLAAAKKQHAESKKQEQAEEKKAHAAQVRRGVLQKKASKAQKRKQQNWDADITKDNIIFNTPKGSGSSSRSRAA